MQWLSLKALVAMNSELNCSLDSVNQKLELSTLRLWNNEMAVNKVEWSKTLDFLEQGFAEQILSYWNNKALKQLPHWNNKGLNCLQC